MELEPIIIPADLAGERLDKALSQLVGNLSRSRLQALIAEGAVTCDDAAATNPKAKVRAGQAYHITMPEVVESHLEPIKMPLDVVFEDAHVIVINKPQGLTVHPAASTGSQPTLVHGLLAHCGDSLSGIGGEARPGIVHRIDKDTSGLLIVAKHDNAHQHLSAQLADRSLKRTYLCLAWGVPNPLYDTIETEIARSKSDRKKMAVVESGGKFARTHFEAIAQYNAPLAKDRRTLAPFASKILCELDTGRTHQIRVHLAHIGHPLLCDPVYGAQTSSKLSRFALGEEMVEMLQARKGQMLHAYGLRFIHPESGEEMTFEVPPPQAMETLTSHLQKLDK